MIPIAPGFVVIPVVGAFAIGVVVGVVSGLLSSVILRIGLNGIWMNAMLGAIAIPIGYILATITPVRQHTIFTPNGGGGETAEIVSRFQHPLIIAFILAAILPALRCLYRLRQTRTNQAVH